MINVYLYTKINHMFIDKLNVIKYVFTISYNKQLYIDVIIYT